MGKKKRSRIEDLAATLAVPHKGKKAGKVVFNREEYDDFALQAINCSDHTVEVVTRRYADGSVDTKEINPSQMFREGTLKPLLKRAGLDDKEATELANSEILKLGGFYELAHEIDYQYMTTGRRIDFIPREEFSGSLYVENMEAKDKDYPLPKSDKVSKKHIEEHVQLKTRSKAPKNRIKER